MKETEQNEVTSEQSDRDLAKEATPGKTTETGETRERKVQRHGEGPGGGEAPAAIEDHVASTRGGGDRLGGGILQKMNDAFGADFGDVGIHTDTESAQACRAMGAQAFTVGNDVYFDEGKFDPGSEAGQQLIGHELTHVVQQGGGGPRRPQAKLAVGQQNDAAEQEADAMGAKAAKGEKAKGKGGKPGEPGAEGEGEGPPKVFAKGDEEGTAVSESPEQLRMTPADAEGGVRDYSIVGKVPDLIQSHIATDVEVTSDAWWRWIWKSRWVVYDASDQAIEISNHRKHTDKTLTPAMIKKGVPSDGGSNKWTIRFETMETGKPWGGASRFPWDQSYFHVYASPIANAKVAGKEEIGPQIAVSTDFTSAVDGGSYELTLTGTTSRTESGSETITNTLKVSTELERSASITVDGITGGMKNKVGIEASNSIAKTEGYSVSKTDSKTEKFNSGPLKGGKTYKIVAHPKFIHLQGAADVLSQNLGIVSSKENVAGGIRIFTGYSVKVTE